MALIFFSMGMETRGAAGKAGLKLMPRRPLPLPGFLKDRAHLSQRLYYPYVNNPLQSGEFSAISQSGVLLPARLATREDVGGDRD
jgi:hypothetical protein